MTVLSQPHKDGSGCFYLLLLQLLDKKSLPVGAAMCCFQVTG